MTFNNLEMKIILDCSFMMQRLIYFDTIQNFLLKVKKYLSK